MEKFRKYTITLFLITTVILLSGCKDWLDVNVSEDTPTSVPADQTLPTVVFYASQICYDHAEYGIYLSQALTTGG
ncbi:MAG: SusD/RagB family nutrient-binding outer membrane lipoprotein, partial [Paludibacter sp.]